MYRDNESFIFVKGTLIINSNSHFEIAGRPDAKLRLVFSVPEAKTSQKYFPFLLDSLFRFGYLLASGPTIGHSRAGNPAR
jgi:hypothetical protein